MPVRQEGKLIMINIELICIHYSAKISLKMIFKQSRIGFFAFKIVLTYTIFNRVDCID